MTPRPPLVITPDDDGRFDPDPLDSGQVVAGDPETGDRHLATWSDGTITGIWRCTPGRFTDIEVDETFIVLEGRASIRQGGSVTEVGPGDVCVLGAGAETEWTVTETVVKVYVAAAGLG
jgi:uncharacterized cupin superfamily protein